MIQIPNGSRLDQPNAMEIQPKSLQCQLPTSGDYISVVLNAIQRTKLA